MLHENFKKIGEKLFQRGMNNSHSGNISIREGDKIFISRTGSMLDELNADDIVRVGLEPDQSIDQFASMELLVHRAIYNRNSDVKSVVHAHVPYAVVLGANHEEIIPYDDEGRYFLKSIPVLKVNNSIASEEVKEKIPSYINASHGAVIVAKHGVFAWGKSLEEAYHYIMVTQSICKINYLLSKE